MSTYDFSTLYTTLPHHLIKDKLIDLIEDAFSREKKTKKTTLYLACNEKVYEALVYLLDNISIRFGTKLYGQIISIPTGTTCAPLVADLFLFCYERDFMKSLSTENQAYIFEAFNSISRYLGELNQFKPPPPPTPVF